MTESAPSRALAAEFESQRARLLRVASRVLGSQADAEDAVQEAWLRLARQDHASIENVPGWLTTVVGRICIDMLRARTAKAETSVDDERLGWVVTAEDDGPERNAEVADSVGLALLMVLDTLTPDERLAFVLRDTFGVPFDDIARIIGRTVDATKMLASRARKKVRGAHHPADRQRQRQVVDAFLAAAREGDFDALLNVLDPDVTWRVHSARGDVVRIGSTELAGKTLLGRRANVTARRVSVNGQPGVLAWRRDGRPLAVMACTVEEGRIVAVESITNPALLAAMCLPALDDLTA